VRFPPLIEGRLLRRYRRFFADVQLPGGVVTAVVPNTGSLLSCAVEGAPVWLREATSPARKFRYDWVLVRPKRSLVCIDTGVPNKVVLAYSRAQKIPHLAGFREYVPEVPYGGDSRADLLCRVHHDDMLRRCWVEVKSTTLVRGGVAFFPDAVTTRGLKHLHTLTRMVEAGDEALQVFFVQRSDCRVFRPADDIDPSYGQGLRRAVRAGVRVLALRCRVETRGITIRDTLRVEL
jgi:sugar fermentation stimulation protein A